MGSMYNSNITMNGVRRGARMHNIYGSLQSSLVTILIVIFYLYTVIAVGGMRGKHQIKAPACVGHPEFERAYRVQMNTLEQMVVVLPLLWLATLYPILPVFVAPLLGVIWVLGRILYMRAYMADPDKRGPGAMLGALCCLGLLLLAVAGLVKTWIILG